MQLDPTLIILFSGFIIGFFLNWLILAGVFFISGRIVSGIYTTAAEAIFVSLIGSIVKTVVEGLMFILITVTGYGVILYWYPSLISLISVLIIYLYLFMKYFDTGIFGATAISMISLVFILILNILVIWITTNLQTIMVPTSLILS